MLFRSLRRQGYASVIFEALDKPGGMLRAGIPAWHLPEDILDREIAKLHDDQVVAGPRP